MSMAVPVEESAASPLSMPNYPWLSLSGSAVKAANEIVGKRRQVHFRLLDETFWFRFTAKPLPGEPVAHYALQFGEDCVLVSLFAAIPKEWTAPSFRGVSSENLPPDLQDIVLEASVAPLLELLGSLYGKPPHLIQGVTTDAKATNLTTYSWEAGRVENNVLLRGEFQLSPAAHTKLLSALDLVKPEANERWDCLPYPVSVEVGSTVIKWGDIKSLQDNDVILLDNGFSLDKPECLVLIGDKQINAKRNGDQVTTSGRLASLVTMSTAPSPTPAEAAPSRVSAEDLPVRLSFTLGDAELTFRELKSLQEGYTFVLNRPVASPVQIRAQGAIVGVGELLMVGDQVGVRVIELNLGP